MKVAGMPVLPSAARAACVCCWTKPAAPVCGMCVGCAVAPSAAGVLLAEPVAGMGPGDRPICRSSCFMIASDSPPGRPLSCVASWVSSMSVPMLVPALSSAPVASVVERMLLTSSFMNSDSNCREASRTAPRGSLAARDFRLSSDRVSVASPPGCCGPADSGDAGTTPMLRDSRFPRARHPRSSWPAGSPAGPSAWRPWRSAP